MSTYRWNRYSRQRGESAVYLVDHFFREWARCVDPINSGWHVLRPLINRRVTRITGERHSGERIEWIMILARHQDLRETWFSDLFAATFLTFSFFPAAVLLMAFSNATACFVHTGDSRRALASEHLCPNLVHEPVFPTVENLIEGRRIF